MRSPRPARSRVSRSGSPRRATARRSVALVILAVAGCGDEDTSDPAAARRIAEAAERTLDTGSARQRVELRVADQIDATIVGVVDLVRDDSRAHITYRRFPGLDPGDEVDLITHDDVDYFREPGSQRWLETETTEEDAISNALDVPSSLQSLGSVSEDVRERGRERRDGVVVTRSSAHVAPARVAETFPDEQAERYRRRARALPDEVPVEIWIDREDRIREMHYDFIVDRPGILPGEARIVVTLELDDFGVDARIERPPPRLTDVE